ncbi:hypothetical protein [Tropicibacter sp. S64]|uniref:hypothetical protein n=1 Tax=Tropicibacter sp. S64 TaxID=3415122 RepID=UPI003C7C9CFE
MNNATLKSARLQRVLKVLRDGKKHSSWEIMSRGKAPSPGTCVSELRQLGAKIDCKRETGPNGQPIWYYTMTKGPRENG